MITSRVKSNRSANLVDQGLIRIDRQSSFDPRTNFENHHLTVINLKGKRNKTKMSKWNKIRGLPGIYRQSL